MKIELVQFNTKTKAENCLRKLGSRGIDVFTIEYKSNFWGYYVRYWTDGKPNPKTH